MQYIPNIFSKLFSSGAAVADLLFFAVALFVAVTSLILFFHWRRYGMGGVTLAITEMVYLAVCVVLLGAAFFTLN